MDINKHELVREQLFKIKHPVYLDAEIDPDVTWKLTCGHCGTEHKFNTNTVKLDQCCNKPIYGEINENY